MASGSVPLHPTSQTVHSLLAKLKDVDADFRFMSLNDLLQVLTIGRADFLHHDYNVASRTVDGVVTALDDTNGEVQNLAIKCIGPLIKKMPSTLVGPLMDRLTALKLQNSVDNSIRALALRAAVSNLPRPIPGAPMTKEVVEAYSSISRLLIPRVLHQGQLIPSQTREEYEANYELSAENIDVIIEVLTCFGSMLVPPEIEAIETALLVILENRKSNSVVKKRAVVALSLLAVYLPDAPLSLLVQRISKSLSSGKLTPVNRRLFVTIMGSMARSIPARFGRHLPELVPFILRALSEEELQAHNEQVKEGGEAEPEFDEIREAALVALEAFLASCPQQMRPYTDEILQASLRYLKYDPNYVAEDDEEMDVDDSDADEEDEEEEDDEFGDDAGFDDDDDTSWKVRRCAAKVLYTLISTRGSGDLLDNGVLYSQAAPVLIKRFDEREENVRLEILSTMAQLVRKTGEDVILPPTSDDIPELFQQQPQSRKRRRQSSTGALPRGLSFSESSGGVTSPVLEKIPSSGPRADLARITPSIVRGLTKLLKGKLIPTKQASISLLDDLVLVQRGGLSAHLGQLIDVVIDAVKPSSGSSALSSTASVGGQASATVTTLRVAALRLISDIARTHSSATLRPHLSKIVAVVVTAANDRFYKLSAEAIRTAEEVTKMITPPRSQSSLQDYQPELLKLYNVVMERTASIDADLEVRQRAIHALGTLLARTSNKAGVTLLTDAMRRAAFDQLVERLKNETTRMAAVKAVDNVAAFADSSVKPAPAWVREVALELSAQLRKANRSIRGASAQALKHLVLSPATKGSFDPPTIKGIVEALVPVVVSNDSHLLGPAVVVLAELISVTPDLVVTPQVIAALCEVIKTSVAGSILDAILVFVNNAGQAGMARPLMASLLHDVSVSGDSSVVGKIIGQLLVAGGSNVGVTLDSFIKEAETAKDAPRAILALSVLGEAGMRLGPQSPLKPENFLSQFKEQPDKVSSAAAVALGRAGAGNVSVYLPVILNAMASGGTKQYLLLQSIREILQQVTVSNTDIGAFSQDIWTQLVNASQSEDNKAMCAECIGRLAIVDPNKFMPMLKQLLQDQSPTLRALVVQSIRYTLPENDEAFDNVLKHVLVDMLLTMLQDNDMEIQRLAMTTLNSAAHNKPELILPRLGQLMPYVMRASIIRPDLIREVMMGPFKHTVDEGLDLRKSAYETLYALMETAFMRINSLDLWDRVVAGLRDDNEIRALCNLMVSKLAVIDPEETTRRLDSIAECYRATLSVKLKDGAVRQDVEKHDEAVKSVLRVTLLLAEKKQMNASSATGGTSAAPAANQVWNAYWDWVNKDFERQLRQLRAESRDGGGT